MNANKFNTYKMNDKTINAIGPLQERMERDPNVWNEIEHYGEYYYFRIGFYRSISGEPAPRPGYTWYPVGRDNYMVVDEMTLAEFSNTHLCDLTSQIMLECNTNDELEDFTQETPVYVKDILTMLLKNHDTLLTVVSTISQKTQLFIEAGKLDKLEASLNLKLVENRIGMNTDIFTELFEMTYLNCYCIGPVSVRLNPSKYWDVVEVEYGKSFYYFRKGYYGRVTEPRLHWINLVPHQSIYICQTEYIVIDNDKFDSKGDCELYISETTIPKEEATIPKEEATIPKEETTPTKVPTEVPNEVVSNLEDVLLQEPEPKESWCCIC
jgi:hypothetical protein